MGSPEGTTFTIVPRAAVLLLGALCFMSFLGEGAVLDWSAVFLREQRQVDVSLAGMGYATFSVAMTICRFGGDRVHAPVRTAPGAPDRRRARVCRIPRGGASCLDGLRRLRGS
jgi:hypothetical protein